MERDRSAQPLAVRYVRAGTAGAGRARLQEWRSELTGRVFEVDERDAYASADELEPGAVGFLVFAGGTAAVTRRPGDPPPRPGSGGVRRTAGDPVARAPRRPRGIWPWLLVAVLAAVILLRELGR